MSKKAIVIGSGVGGLASAIRLACKGYEVKVFEANNFIGGKINSETHNGYRFDMGPSVFTCPEYIKELYELAGEDFSEFPYQRLEHSFNYFYNDGSNFLLNADKEKLVTQLSEQFNENPGNIKDYLAKAEQNYKHITPLFIEKSLHKIGTYMGSDLFKALSRLRHYNLQKTMHEENNVYFRNPKTVQFFNRYATYNGSNPYDAPAMLNMISSLELNEGAYIPKNGMVQITQLLYDLAIKKGVKFYLNEKVKEILHNQKNVTGIVTEIDEKHEAEIVFSNMDVSYTYERLLNNYKAPQKVLNQERSTSAMVFYWGIKKEFPQTHLHNIFFADDYKKEFQHLFKTKTLSDDPTIYINITSKYVPTDAPEGCENWFVMINAPSLEKDHNWLELQEKARSIIVNKINKVLNTDIESFIVTETSMNPEDIKSKYSAKQGSIYGNSSNNKLAAFFRHPNFSKNLKGLYFVGVTVHPGGGIPLALNSAKIAVAAIKG